MDSYQVFYLQIDFIAGNSGVDSFNESLTLMAYIYPVMVLGRIVNGKIVEFILVFVAAKMALQAFIGPFKITLYAK